MPTLPFLPRFSWQHSLLILLIAAVIGGAGWTSWSLLKKTDGYNPSVTTNQLSTEVKKFESEQDFRDYLARARSFAAGAELGLGSRTTSNVITPEPADNSGGATSFSVEPIGQQLGLGEATSSGPTISKTDRYSTTNVQVLGIDEPDLVKNDGTQLYVSTENTYDYGYDTITPTLPGQKYVPPVKINNATNIIKALPADTVAKLGSIDKVGNLLLTGSTLVVFASDGMYAYDISAPATPKEVWKDVYGQQNQLETARLMNNKLYVVTRRYMYDAAPCPLKPLTVSGQEFSIPCTEIYHPVSIVPADVTYTAMVINPANGQVEKSTTFIAASGSSVVSMSAQALYLGYTVTPDPSSIWLNFYLQDAADLYPATLIDHLRKVNGYDLSSTAKMTEIEYLLGEYYQGLDSAAQKKLSDDMEQRMDTYAAVHVREFMKTGLIKISLDTFKVVQTGEVPGQLLNQFAIDEFDGHLRVATSSSGGWWFGTDNSVNDVYVLDQNLKRVGSVLDLGKGERIYSVRFLGNRGYVVTFKQVDPFYVLDLSNPKTPAKKGELKIPGYSSYLHPISDNLILGVGQDGTKVKVALFNVTDPTNPTEAASQQLTCGWSAIQTNHHAFLLDTKHNAFFMPAGNQGFVVSYTPTSLTVAKTISSITAKRAVYINDNMYVIGAHDLVVLRETDWQQIGSLSF